jgi:cystathionine beta-synthase
MSCALRAIKDANLSADKKCVIIFPDSIRNYMTKFLTKNWMLEKNLMSETVLENTNEYSWWNNTVSQIGLETPITLLPSATVQHSIDTMKRNGLTQIPVVSADWYGANINQKII